MTITELKHQTALCRLEAAKSGVLAAEFRLALAEGDEERARKAVSAERSAGVAVVVAV